MPPGMNFLVEHGILERSAAALGRDEYILTDKANACGQRSGRCWPGGTSSTCRSGGADRSRTPAAGASWAPTAHANRAARYPGPDDLTIHPQPARSRAVKTDP